MNKLLKLVMLVFLLTGCATQNYLQNNRPESQKLKNVYPESQGNQPKAEETFNYPSKTDTSDSQNKKYQCSDITSSQAVILYRQGHTYLDKDGDGKPCELKGNYPTKQVEQPVQQKSNCHQVKGYTRKNGTYVSGYTRCR